MDFQFTKYNKFTIFNFTIFIEFSMIQFFNLVKLVFIEKINAHCKFEIKNSMKILNCKIKNYLNLHIIYG